MTSINIGSHQISDETAPFVIAEISANHNGSVERAMDLIDAAAKTGADAVKLQTFRADTITLDSHRPEFMIHGGEWDGRRLYDLYEEAHTPWEWHADLFKRGQELGLVVFSSPFDATAVDFLEDLACPIYKIASPELVDLPLIAKVAATGKPMIMSTGMGSDTEIAEAVKTAERNGCRDLMILHCVSGYPTPVEASNLARIHYLRERFGHVVGLSDHTKGIEVPVAAIANGAAVIEKHFTLSHADGGLDAAFSLDVDEFTTMTAAVKNVHKSLHQGVDAAADAQKSTRAFRRSLYVTTDIKAGDILNDTCVRSVRPSNGLAPKHYWDVLGKKASRDLKAGEPLSWDMIE